MNLTSDPRISGHKEITDVKMLQIERSRSYLPNDAIFRPHIDHGKKKLIEIFFILHYKRRD